MSALDACHAAHASWMRSQPQLFLEVDDLTSSAPRVAHGGQRPNPTSGAPRVGAETVRPATNGTRERANASPASLYLPRGEAVRDGLAATPFQTKERR